MGRHGQPEKGQKQQHQQAAAKGQQTGVGKVRADKLSAVEGCLCPVDRIRTVGVELALCRTDDVIRHQSQRHHQQHRRKYHPRTAFPAVFWERSPAPARRKWQPVPGQTVSARPVRSARPAAELHPDWKRLWVYPVYPYSPPGLSPEQRPAPAQSPTDVLVRS